MVMAEVDIAADGSIKVTPNPVHVASGENLFFHVNSNASDASKLSIHFPGGAKSPFGAMNMDVTVTATHCTAGGTLVRWPPGVDRATVNLSAHGSPERGSLKVEVRRAEDKSHHIDIDQRSGHHCTCTGEVAPQGPAADQAYAITVKDSKITASCSIGVGVSNADCIKVQSKVVSDGEAVVVIECVKVEKKCKACETTVTITVLDKDANVIARKEAKISCQP